MLEFSKSILDKSSKFSEIVLYCKYLLHNSNNAYRHKKYVFGRAKKQQIKNFEIGFFPPNSNLHELTKLVGINLLLELGLIYHKQNYEQNHLSTIYQGVFTNHNLIMPYYDEYGNIISLIGRSLLSPEERTQNQIPKYKNTTFKKSLHLYGLNQAKHYIMEKDYVIIVEGQFDVITCHTYDIKNVVGLGCSHLSLYQFYLIKKYTNNIYLLLDNDESGENGEKSIFDRFSSKANIYKIYLPKNFDDIDSFLRQKEITFNQKKEILCLK